MTTRVTPNLLVDARSLGKRFAHTTALDDVTLGIRPGEIVALLGPNGAGKSTFVEAVVGLMTPGSGTIHTCGLAPAEAVKRGLVSAMLQEGAIPPGITVQRFLESMLGLRRHPRPLASVVEESGVGGIMRSSTQRLSGGELQRVRYALAVMEDPDLLILDEPTVSLDVDARRLFWESVQAQAHEGRAILFATHYLDEADAFAGRVVVLDQGRVVADGTPADIKRSIPLRRVELSSDPRLDWGALTGVSSWSQVDGRVTLACTDSDEAVRSLVRAGIPFTALAVSVPSLEDAFLTITHASSLTHPVGA